MSSRTSAGTTGRRRTMERLRQGLGTTLLLITSAHAMAAWKLNMPVGVTPISREAYNQHMLMLWWCVGIGVVVFGVMVYSLLRHRKAAGAEAAQFHHSTLAEIGWTVVPVLILISMAIPATKALIVAEDTTDADITVKVTGYQWKWRYEYLEDGVSFFSSLARASREAVFSDPSGVENYLSDVDNPVVVPVGEKVRFLITADDVIHSWWVPALGMKKDAIPGFINEMWAKIDEPGVYRGQCAELCGKDHGYMPIVVIAKSQTDYRQWVADQKKGAVAAQAETLREWTRDELMERGKSVYVTVCSACHQPDGRGLPPSFPPLTGSAITTGPLDAHLSRVMYGKQGTAMQAFAKQLSDTDIAGVITYERNALGNSVGDMIQPSAVKTARN